MIFCAVLIFACVLKSHGQLISPCPRLFTYEPKGQENDRWYGIITLLSESELSGVWLRIILDKPSLQLGNWFGEVVTSDNKDYLIKNRGFQLKAQTPQTVRFYVKYNLGEAAPQLTGFRLNAKTVCPEGVSTTPAATTGGQLQTSSELSTTASPEVVPQRPPSGGNFWNRPGPATDEDDFFQGDFALFGKPPSSQSNSSPSVQMACGTVVAQPRPLITHGVATNEGQFPWHAALYHVKGIDLAYICGASLISQYHVITVAHCVTRRRSQSPLNPDSLVVYLGKYYLKKWSNTGIQDRQVTTIVPHPDYNPQTYGNDIALVKLSAPVEFTDFVRPICMWEGSPDLNTVLNKPGTVVGWGFDETGRVTEQLTQAQMPVVSHETCIYSFPDFFSRFTSSKTYCAGFRNGTSVCNGDSGGGMVFPKPTSSRGSPVWQLRGLVSISVALQNQFRCDAAHYVVFTDVAKYLDWVKASMAA